MSKKQKKTNKRSNSIPLLALAGGIVLVVAGVLFAMQGRRSPAEGNGIPDIDVSPGMIEYGDVKLDTPLTFKIDVTNKGDGTLRIEDEPYLEVLEGC